MIKTFILEFSYIILLCKTQVNINIFHHLEQKIICIKKSQIQDNFMIFKKNSTSNLNIYLQ
jgi:hypothetical protein